EDRPLFVQFYANDLDTLLKVAKRVEAYCDYVDINLREDLNKHSKLSFEFMYDMVDRLRDLRVTTPLYEESSLETVHTGKDEEQVH
nr:tRNA-dihydrouridine(16/17) synthase [NAD(P)(+)]-like [Tanacetum cinerariifolium]